MKVSFLPMTEQRFATYVSRAITEYASDKVKAGNWDADTALERSRSEFHRYLPQGAQTPGHSLCCILNEAHEEVGVIWYGTLDNAKNVLFLYDFEVHENYRGKGYALQSLQELEKVAKENNCEHIELHVFGYNVAAQNLYLKAGFTITNINMRKIIKK